MRPPAYDYVFGGRLPGIEVVFANGLRETVLLDTGAPTALSYPRARSDELPLTGALEAGPVVFGAGGGSIQTLRGPVGPVRVGPRSYERLAVTFSDRLPMAIAGMEVLRGMIVVLDPANARNWVCPPEAAGHCDIGGSAATGATPDAGGGALR